MLPKKSKQVLVLAAGLTLIPFACKMLQAQAQPQGFRQAPAGQLEQKNQARMLYNDSIGLYNSGKLKEAESRLRAAQSLDPSDENILNNLGMVLLKLGRADEAKAYLQSSIKLKESFPAPYLNLALAYESSGDLQSAKTYLEKYMSMISDRKQKERIKEHVDAIKKTLQDSPVRAESGSGGDDYLNQLGSDKIYPWPKERSPIKIFIADGQKVPGYKHSYGAALNRALGAWSEVLAGQIQFELIDNSTNADINIKWSNDINQALMKAEGGDCRYTANGAGMDHAEVTILTLDPSNSDRLNDYKVSWVALHELGHALGITGHSYNPGDVMYFSMPQQETLPELSARDKATIKRIYTEKLADTWLTLNEAGLKLLRDSKPAEALQKFKQAYSLNPGQEVVKQNIIAALANVSVEQISAGKYKEAELALLEAIELDKNKPGKNFKILLSNYELVLRKTGRGRQVGQMYEKYAPSQDVQGAVE